ncbi:MAG: hypothetical protein HYX74_06720 [Acidobacteria bacterium]|nr:hypothetical protein [Acidobacteriota bacterium]
MQIPPDNIKPVDPREFAFALRIGSAAFGYRMPVRLAGRQELLVEDESGSLQEVVLEDTPLNRAALAIWEQFGSDHEKFQCLMMRYFALVRLARHAKMQQWQMSIDDGRNVMVHPAVLVVAATLPLQSDGGFDEKEFFTRVQESVEADGA